MKEEIGRKILNCLYIVIILLTVIALTIMIKDFTKGSTSSNNNEKTSSTSDYDAIISEMESVNVSKLLSYFEDDSTYVVYLGSASCGYCVQFAPILKEAQEDYDYKTIYLDVTTVSTTSNDFKSLQAKLDVKKTYDGETKTFGEFFGMTPMVFVIKSGKMIDGMIGATNYANLVDFLKDSGAVK